MTGTFPEFDDDVWELYGPDDWSQAHDLAAQMPGKLHELQRLFLIEAERPRAGLPRVTLSPSRPVRHRSGLEGPGSVSEPGSNASSIHVIHP